MPQQLFNREVSLTLGDTKLEKDYRFASSSQSDGKRKDNLRITFEIVKTLTVSLNTANIKLYNLAEETRKTLQPKGTPIKLSAGYRGTPSADSKVKIGTSLIFQGTSTYLNDERESADWVTSLDASDGFYSYAVNTVNKGKGRTYRAGRAFQDILKDLAADMELGDGNMKEVLDDAIAKGTVREKWTHVRKGYTAHGLASEAFSTIAASMGFEWSIENESVLLLKSDGGVRPQKSELLSPETGLIGSPQYGESDKKRGKKSKKGAMLKARSLLNGLIVVGGTITLQARLTQYNKDQQAEYKVVKLTHRGDTCGDDWFTDIEAETMTK